MERKGERIFLSIKLRLWSNLRNRVLKSSGFGVNLGKQKQNTMNLEEFKVWLSRRFPWAPGINYMSVDSDGDCYQYVNKPKVLVRYWWPNCGAYKCVGGIELPDNIDWRETLISRAETEQPTQPAAPTFEQRHDALMAKLDELIGVMRAVVEAVQPVNDYKGVNEQQ